jgi:DNA-binding beta-propeller fold protein YncE
MTAFRRLPVLGLVCLAALVGCSSSSHSSKPAVPPAAEPSSAPPVAVAALPGTIVDLPRNSAPEGVAADPGTHTVVVALRTPDRIALVDSRTLHVRIRGIGGRARHLVLARAGGPLLFPAEDTDQLIQVALPSGQAIRTTVLPSQPHNATVIGNHYWVDDELAGELSVLDHGGHILATLKGPVQPGGVAAAAGRVGAVDVRGARMYFYDQNTYRSEGSIALGAGPTHAAYIGGNDVVVADTRGGALLVVDMAQRRIVSRLPLPGGPYGLAVDAATDDVFVTLTQSNQLVHLTVSGNSLRVVGRTPTVQQPNTVGYDPTTRCSYVAGVAHAQLQVLCPGEPIAGH